MRAQRWKLSVPFMVRLKDFLCHLLYTFCRGTSAAIPMAELALQFSRFYNDGRYRLRSAGQREKGRTCLHRALRAGRARGWTVTLRRVVTEGWVEGPHPSPQKSQANIS